MSWIITDRGWPVAYTEPLNHIKNSTKWSPYIYPTYSYNGDIEKINTYQSLQKQFYYDWTSGKNIDIWA